MPLPVTRNFTPNTGLNSVQMNRVQSRVRSEVTCYRFGPGVRNDTRAGWVKIGAKVRK